MAAMGSRSTSKVSGNVRLVKRSRTADAWYLKYRLPSGRQVQKKLGPAWTERGNPRAGYYTRRMAQAELDAILTDARRGEIPEPENRAGKTFGDAVAEWLRYCQNDKARRASTLRDYRNTAAGSLLPEFGAETPLEEITTDRVEVFRSRILGEDRLSRRTVQKQLVLLSGVFKRAKALRWVESNPVDAVERVSVARSGEFNVLSAAEVDAVAAKAGGIFGAAILVAAYTGLRTGELRALRWRHVSFSNSAIRVQRNMPAGGEEDSPKSGKVRSVPLMDDAARELDRLSRREKFVGPDDVVFCGPDGGMLGEDALRKALYKALAEAGVDRKAFPARGGFTFHDLRHTFGTLAAQVWPLHDVQAFMGHADIQTTMRYAHHVPKRDAAIRFTEFVERERGADAEVNGPTRSAGASVAGARDQDVTRR
jgi:integrase